MKNIVIRSSLVTMLIVVSVYYFSWRFSVINHEQFVLSSLLFFCEVYALVGILLSIFTTLKLTNHHSQKPNKSYSVDVFIPIYNESLDILRATLIGAKKMHYHHKIYVLDDGNRKEVRHLAKQMGVNYISRKNNLHAKAGNLNNALKKTTGDLIAIFDTDHIPCHNFIKDTIGFFNDSKVAFVQTPQSFYNNDSFEHMGSQKSSNWTTQSHFFNVILRGKDFWNAAFFCGSCAILRRSAIEEIGGFATESITEDVLTSIRLHKAGYRSIYYHIPLSYGIATLNAKNFISQRLRWGRGAMQIWRSENIVFTNKLSLAQKICYLDGVIYFGSSLQKLILFLIPLLMLFFGVSPINTTLGDLVLHLGPLFLVSYLVYDEFARGYGKFFSQEKFHMIGIYSFSKIIMDLFIGLKPKFVVTNKSVELNRNKFIYLPQITLILISIASLVYGYFVDTGLDKFAKDVAIFWVLIQTCLMISILSHSFSKDANRRLSYRFTLPHAIRIFKEDEIYNDVISLNISPEGLMFDADKNTYNKTDTIKGIIYLFDSNRLEFHATIKNIFFNKSTKKYNVGIEFTQSTELRLSIEQYIYGENYQHQVNNLSEHRLTVIGSLIKLFKGEKFYGDTNRINTWFIVYNKNKEVAGVAGINKSQKIIKSLLFKQGNDLYIQKQNKLKYDKYILLRASKTTRLEINKNFFYHKDYS